MRVFTTKVILKIGGALGEAIAVHSVIQGDMSLIDSVLVGLISAFFISLGRKEKTKEGKEEKVEINIPAEEFDDGLIIKGLQRKPLPA